MLRLTKQISAHLYQFFAALRSLPFIKSAQVWEHCYFFCNRSAFFVVSVMAFAGAIMVMMAASQALHLLGDFSMVGPAFLHLLIREFAPLLVSFMVATRYGAGVAAELAAMTVSEQVDALRLAGVNIQAYLVMPRLLAGVITIVPLTVVGGAAAFFAGSLVALSGYGMSWQMYFNPSLLETGDIVVGGIKALGYGLIVVLVACEAGLSAEGGSPSVGKAATEAVVGGIIVTLFFDLGVGLCAHGLGI